VGDGKPVTYYETRKVADCMDITREAVERRIKFKYFVTPEGERCYRQALRQWALAAEAMRLAAQAEGEAYEQQSDG
jgi:hypothetical protein